MYPRKLAPVVEALFKDFESLYAARGDYHSKLKAMMPCLAGLSGNLLKYSSIANDLALNDKLVKSYIEILELMFIIKRMPAYLKNRAKRLAVHMPKMHYVDTGLACHLLGLRREAQLLNSPYYGGLLQNLIYMECYKQAAWAEEEVNLSGAPATAPAPNPLSSPATLSDRRRAFWPAACRGAGCCHRPVPGAAGPGAGCRGSWWSRAVAGGSSRPAP